MTNLFELAETGRAVQLVVDFESDWLERSSGEEKENSDLFRIAQEHAVSSLINFTQLSLINPNRLFSGKSYSIIANYRHEGEFGQHEELGHILFQFDTSNIDLTLLHLELYPGSVKGKLIAGIGAASVFFGGMYVYEQDIKAEIKYREIINRSACATSTKTSFKWHNHIENLISGLPSLDIPKTMSEADKRSTLAPDERVCAFQAMLLAEHYTNLNVDGIWGPNTFAAWQSYKARNWQKGQNFDDPVALNYLVRDARDKKVVYMAILNITFN